MTLPALQSYLDHFGIRVSLKLVVDAPAGVLTREIKAELVRHKPALLAVLVGQAPGAQVAGPSSAVEPGRCAVEQGAARAPSDAKAAVPEAINGIPPAKATPRPVQGSRNPGPRDVRNGDRWLPWHLTPNSSAGS